MRQCLWHGTGSHVLPHDRCSTHSRNCWHLKVVLLTAGVAEDSSRGRERERHRKKGVGEEREREERGGGGGEIDR